MGTNHLELESNLGSSCNKSAALESELDLSWNRSAASKSELGSSWNKSALVLGSIVILKDSPAVCHQAIRCQPVEAGSKLPEKYSRCRGNRHCQLVPGRKPRSKPMSTSFVPLVVGR